MDFNLINKHKAQKQESLDFKERRFEQWNENYSLYRDKVNTNRLTQRQPINIPIMRDTIQTWVSKIDEAPELTFKTRNNKEAKKNGELMVDQMWKYFFEKGKFDILDNLDKKIVGLQGRSFKIAGISRGEFFVDVIDPYDIELDPKVNILDLNSAQYIKRTHIFKPLREILANKKYTKEGKDALKIYLDSKEGLLKANEAETAYDEKVSRLQELGADNFEDMNASDVMVELNECYDLVWSVEENQFIRHMIVIALDNVILYNKPLSEAIGINRVPIVTWADDPDLNDIWCDGKGDSVRTINKVVNMYISQDVENRAYTNFGMYFFNTMNGTFQPRAFEAKPFGMYGIPGNPKEIMQKIDVPSLNDTTNQIQFLKDMIQSTVAQTPTERGIAAGSRTTLGEVEINLQQSQGRNSVSSKHYRRAWKEIGQLFVDLMENNASTQAITLYKAGADGKMAEKTISGSEWITESGYECIVAFKEEQGAKDQYDIQKSQYVISNFQDNPEAIKIAKRKQLELMGWSDEDIAKAMSFEDRKGSPQMEGLELPQGAKDGRMFNNQQVMQQNEFAK